MDAVQVYRHPAQAATGLAAQVFQQLIGNAQTGIGGGSQIAQVIQGCGLGGHPFQDAVVQTLQLGQAGRHALFANQNDGALAGVVEVGQDVRGSLVEQVLDVIDDQRATAPAELLGHLIDHLGEGAGREDGHLAQDGLQEGLLGPGIATFDVVGAVLVGGESSGH
ncbi:hypothetical protein D9M70_404570 [compost metagenome]